MVESNLTYVFSDLMKRTAYFLGWQRRATVAEGLSGNEALHLDDMVQDGVRQFYHPPQHDARKPPHEWTFLEPIATLTAWAVDAKPVQSFTFNASSWLNGTVLVLASGTLTADMVGALVWFQETPNDTYRIFSIGGTTVVAVDPVGPSQSTSNIFSVKTTFSSATYDSSDGKTTFVVTVQSGTLIAGLVGQYVWATLSGTTAFIEITDFVSTTSFKVSGDYSAVTAGTLDVLDRLNVGMGVYRLPDDFGGIEGNLNYPANDGFAPVTVVGESQIRTGRQRSNASSRPTYAAVRPIRYIPNRIKDSVHDTKEYQRYDLLLWPPPSQTYSLLYKYNVNPQALTEKNPYHYGGAAHTQTVLASCLAVAEGFMHDDEHGEKWAAFMDRLKASVAIDENANTPESFGVQTDHSDDFELGRHGRWRHHCGHGTVMTYGGVPPT